MRRWLLFVALVVVGAPLAWLAAALALGALSNGGRADDDGIAIHIVSNGFHAGFVFPVAAAGLDWRDAFPPEHFASEIRGYPAVAFGWGEREVYMNTPRIEDLDLGHGLLAILALSSSVAQVQYGHAPPEGERSRRLMLSPARYKRLAAYVRESFATGPDRQPVRIPGRSFSQTDAFYEANGRYSLVFTCNEWVGRGLRAIDAPTGRWTPFAFQVLAHLP
jgi:uncharacterized protein (TIGR02117 family)